ncbi:short chain dehydrogenase [Hypericibacter terrae]|uniref:Short chain dehydrogenase n=1 Tax=Hypericibacter terrae TaxID=2602015 RepID=A0A5J6MNH4_9PROT|nr:SDR family oxidoreductase [Hypericibacter terrae]QEX18781.1 short chain dehydrogenase [Hypericibacter terrae]
MPTLAGKTAVVTGAGSGLGRAVAQKLASEGTAGLVLIDRDKEGLAATREAIAAPRSCDVQSRCLDVTDSAALAEAARKADAAFGGVDIVVCAAGIIGPFGKIVDCSEEDWLKVFAVNVHGTFLTVKHFIPLLRKRGGGSIVNFSSTAGLVGDPLLGPYSASKGAVTLMTRSLARNHAAENIRVNCVCPGSIDTPMLQSVFEDLGDPAARAQREQEFIAFHPLGRFGKPAEVADAVLYLAGPASSFVTGVSLPVDGGSIA